MGRERGFTLIELLVVVAIIGILAAIAIPNMLDAIERSRQKKSVAEIRTMVIAMQTFAVDYGGYPNSSHNGKLYLTLPTILDTDGASIFIPSYIQRFPEFDGWNQPYYYYGSPDGGSGNPRIQGNETVASHYCVYSLGFDCAESNLPDGSAAASVVATNWCQATPVIVGTKETHCFESDIVWGDSSFQQSPEGKQKRCG